MDPSYLDQTSQEVQVVKCVVVGDTNVGKTRLICTRACGIQYSLAQLMTTHTSTVWAIDHYRNDKDILERSWCNVDGMRVSLRLWDTFGYHDKDRRFAYGRADVILLCFSVVQPRTLRSVIQHWYPEIERVCPGVPIVLCGCKGDLRYLYLDPNFIKMDKGPFFRNIAPKDIVTPAQGQAVAQEIGAYYYETSVLVPYGIGDTFLNTMRAALLYKREKHFWSILNNSLKRITKPQCQEPFQPPRPAEPAVSIPPDSWQTDIAKMQTAGTFFDVTFVVQGIHMNAHKLVLMAASPTFETLFRNDISVAMTTAKTLLDREGLVKDTKSYGAAKQNEKEKTQEKKSLTRSHSYPASMSKRAPPAGILTRPTSPTGQRHQDTVRLLDDNDMDVSSSHETLHDVSVLSADVCSKDPFSGSATSASLPSYIQLNHAAFQSVYFGGEESTVTSSTVPPAGSDSHHMIVVVQDSISPPVFEAILSFLYAGTYPPSDSSLFREVLAAAHLLNLKDLVALMTNVSEQEDFVNLGLKSHIELFRRQRLQTLAIHNELLPDVVFELDDGFVAAHRALFVARSDVMASMFSVNFRESASTVIPFPRVSRESFLALQEYLYTGLLPVTTDQDVLEMIELANRLCLPHLRALVEEFCVGELQCMLGNNRDVSEEVLLLLEPAQLHNAEDLAAWCVWYLTCHYREMYKKHSKIVQTLTPENQIHLNSQRWPPLWYLKQMDFYERCLLDLERTKPMRSYLRRRNSDELDRGCLGFCSRRSRNRFKYQPSHVEAILS